MATCDSRFTKMIDGMLLAELSPAKWEQLRAHMRGCADCRDRYNRVSLAERALHGGPAALATPSAAALGRIGRAVVGGERERGLAAVPRWVFGLFAVGVTAALLPFVMRTQVAPVGKPPEFAVRGTATDPAQQAGLRAFCLRGDEVRALDQGAACAAGDLLKLTYSNRAGYEDLFLVGVDDKWELKWYEPRPPSTLSVPAQRAVDQAIPGAIRLGVNHEPGPVRIYALFAHAPIAAREVEDAVAELRRKHASPRDAAALPLPDRDDVTQRSLLIEVTR